jgi:uncharacterized membrane protein
MPITGKNVLGIIGLAVIALFWVVITGTVYGGLFVGVLVVLVVVVLTATQRRKRRPVPDDKPDGAMR